MSKKMNLKNLTMAFATAAQVPTPAADVDVEATRAMVTQKIAEIKQKKAKTTDATPEVKEPKVKAAAKVKEPKAPKVAKPAKVVEEGEEKLFTVAGSSLHKGVVKVRFANDLVARTKILDKAGHTDIKLFELPKPMTKAEIVEYFKTNPEFGIDADAIASKEDSIKSGSKKSALTTPAE